jgi:hypothetical protein
MQFLNLSCKFQLKLNKNRYIHIYIQDEVWHLLVTNYHIYHAIVQPKDRGMLNWHIIIFLADIFHICDNDEVSTKLCKI